MTEKTPYDKDYHRDWYKKNREKHIKNVKRRQKENNYSSEKTDKQRNLRYIKRRTRILYPLFKCLKCEFCDSSATERHHNTTPINIHKFNYICHSCHIDKNMEMK